MKDHSSHLFQQAILVSEKLIRVAILCDEQWHEGLEDALRSGRRAHVYFGIVLPLHPFLPPSLPPSLPFSLPPSLPPLPPPLPPHQDVFWLAQCEGHAVNRGTTSPQNGTWNRDPQRDIFQSRKHISLQLPGRKNIQDQPPNNKVTATRRSFVTCDSSSFKALSSSGREFWSSPYTCKVIK